MVETSSRILRSKVCPAEKSVAQIHNKSNDDNSGGGGRSRRCSGPCCVDQRVGTRGRQEEAIDQFWSRTWIWDLPFVPAKLIIRTGQRA